MKKQLETIVEDIYKKLSYLSEGKELNISEEDYENFGEAMKNALKHWATPYDKKQTIRMSNMGRPNRRLWYDIHREEDANNAISPSTYIKFLYGHLLEEVVLFLARLSGHEVTDEQKEVEVDGIVGHMDCKIDGEVVDIKTASGYGFKKFRDGTLGEDDTFGYLAQLAGYEQAEGTTNGGFLALNKETGELALFQPDDLDKPNIPYRINEIKKTLKEESPPERCYAPVPEGKAGNMKLPRECFYCPHKIECYKDSNDGLGLRAFKYAKGTAYFTTVVTEPKVEEILL
tara:strand:+ start:1500 stop:2360 length:861 start_codon:yes stop_codon:yes gene_type:complete